MNRPSQDNCYADRLLKSDFIRLSDFIQNKIGIKMPLNKMTMVESRLRKRLKSLGIIKYSDYCDFLFSVSGMEKELKYFIDVITTHKTEFFREPDHFEYLVQRAVPELIAKTGSGIKRKLNLWSAASSRGNEVYTIAISLEEFRQRYPGLNFDYFILGTDISADVVDNARKAIYDHDEIEPVPAILRKKYFLKSKDPQKNLVRVVPELRKKVSFRQLNLMDNDFRLREAMDIIFCRNVIIYFDKKTQDDLIMRLCNYLKPDGYLFMGHSEVLHCTESMPLVSIAPAVYRKVY
ncbi:MAG: chemotaxis protein CheR [Deltaproteobacteria bacterium]|nr:chemotaxis protein CheR [Deltaproteobacteria bacterium]